MNGADIERVLRECFPDAPVVELEDGTDYDPYIEAAARIAASDTCDGLNRREGWCALHHGGRFYFRTFGVTKARCKELCRTELTDRQHELGYDVVRTVAVYKALTEGGE